jgi:bifunctional UDP-N-acetylglucosamine pyrophosphorylase / glucosamine-1-phosphate N-acetyltransferase
MIIPAAGMGARLRSPIPKVLLPVNGRPMIEYLFDLYGAIVDVFVLVLNPRFEAEVRRHCGNVSHRIEYALQPFPSGMLDAILAPSEQVRRHRPSRVWITWCDQIAVQPATVRRLEAASDQEANAAVVLPTVSRTDPYVHLVRDPNGEICAVAHHRENEPLPTVGESDLGLFALSHEAYFRLLPEFAREISEGATTGERNFLPFVPWLRGRARVRTVSATDEIESVGINTPEELRRVEAFLRHER